MTQKTASNFKDKWDNFVDGLFHRCDGSSLAVFRILIGSLLMYDVFKTFPYIQWRTRHTLSDFRPNYYGFEWVQLDPTLVALCTNSLPFLAFCIVLGLFYRIAMPLTVLMFTYLFLLFPEHYLNHYYMLLLLCTLMIFTPAHKVWSIDSLIKKRTSDDTDQTVPVWSYWILKIQTEIILIYAGLVKINYDWLNLQPLSTWVRVGTYDIPYIGWFFMYEDVIAFGAYGVILLHVIGAPLLFWKKTRLYVFGLYICFHLANSALFNIGIFPYMTIVATLLFFAPDWPRMFLAKATPITNSFKLLYLNLKSYKPPKKITVTLIAIWMTIQILLPLPVLFTSNLETAWHGHGNFFTWRMMLNNRRIHGAVFVVHIPQRRRIEFVPMRKHLSRRQCTRISWKGNLTVQYANFLEEFYQNKYDTDDVRVHAYINLSVNYRAPELWAKPDVNLAEYDIMFGVHDWQESVDNPLRSWRETVKEPDFENPTYGEILTLMKLPQEEIIVLNDATDTLDNRPGPPDCYTNIEW